MILEKMTRELGLPATFVQNLARAASHEYKTYYIAKRSGGTRTIHHPSRRLKALQRWLLINVIDALPVHPAAAAYRKGRSILQNAYSHAKSRYLLRMDFFDFFPSLTRKDIENYIDQRPVLFQGWTPADIECFCRLVCRNSILTIGAPTSPALSNALCYDLDVALSALADKQGVVYTRYADDLFFSTAQREVLRTLENEVALCVSYIKLPEKLKLNTRKTRHSSKRGARRVTGIVLGSDGNAHIGRDLKRRIRALIHRYGALSDEARASLRGMIAYATGLDPSFMNALIAKYGLTAVRRATTYTAARK